MCKNHLFHKWSNWSEPKTVERILVTHTISYTSRERVKVDVQYRTCERCGRVKERRIKET
jgi:NMD protein affecting ribosome stability and mRNA decay